MERDVRPRAGMESPAPTPRADRRRPPRRGPAARLLDPVYRLARWTVGHVRGVHAEVGAFLAVGMGAAALSAAAFAWLAEGVGAGATRRVDEAVVAWARGLRSPVLDGVAVAGAVLGSGAAAWVALGVGTVVFARTRHLWSAALLWAAVLGARVLNAELKALFGRARPAPLAWDLRVLGEPVAFPTSPSFPSGHAVTTAVLFATLAVLAARLEGGVRARRWTVGAAAAAVALVGLSRVYLGVHYPSDVLAGWLAGFVWATFAAFALEVVRYAAARRPGAARGERGLARGMAPLRQAVRGDPDAG